MNKNITQLTDNEYQIVLDYSDDGVDLQAKKNIIGSLKDAEGYVVVLDRDARMNNAHLFPLPEPPEITDEEMMI